MGLRARQELINELKRNVAKHTKSPHGTRENKRVLILSRKDDAEADFVTLQLMTQGIDCERLNLEDIPNLLALRLLVRGSNSNRSSNALLTCELALGKHSIKAPSLSLAWLRHFNPLELTFTGNEEYVKSFSYLQWFSALRAVQASLDCTWINNPDSVYLANDKTRQLVAAIEHGFTVPRTLITNDHKASVDFFRECYNNMIVKALYHHGVEIKGKMYSMNSRKVKAKDIPNLKFLKSAPCILQEHVQKKSELRVTVVGDQIFVARIDFPLGHEKLGQSGDIHNYKSTELNITADNKILSHSMSEKCKKLVRSLGLQYAAIDFLVNKHDNLCFLEVNPAGDWLWIEGKTGQHITKAVADLISKSI